MREESFPNQEVPITVAQCGQGEKEKLFPPIHHETTGETGLRRLDGALGMTRMKPGSATSSLSVILGSQPEMDYGGKRQPDGQGFAVFDYVTEGIDVRRGSILNPEKANALNP